MKCVTSAPLQVWNGIAICFLFFLDITLTQPMAWVLREDNFLTNGRQDFLFRKPDWKQTLSPQFCFVPLERQKLHTYIKYNFYNHLNIFLNDYGVKKAWIWDRHLCAVYVDINIVYTLPHGCWWFRRSLRQCKCVCAEGKKSEERETLGQSIPELSTTALHS